MEQIPWWKSQTLRALIIAGLAQVVSLLGLTDTIGADVITNKVDGILDLVSLLAMAWAAHSRITKANPPLTDKSAAKEVAVQNDLVIAKNEASKIAAPPTSKQSGRASLMVMTTLIAISGALVMSLNGCAGTTAAYKAAAGDPDKMAYVALEHYDALLQEAIRLKTNPAVTPDILAAIKAADAKVYPVAQTVKRLRDNYKIIKSAPTTEALQTAVNELVTVLADLVDAVKKGRAS